MLLYTLVVLWFADEGHRDYQPVDCPWYRSKAAPSLVNMLTTLRLQSVRQKVFELPLAGPGSRKVQQLLENVLTLAT
jgi:hypothetical protein